MSMNDIYNAVINLDGTNIVQLIDEELMVGGDVQAILNEGLIAPMDEVGRLFSEGVIFVPEMLLAAKTMKTGLNILRPLLLANETKAKETVIIGTVKGDLHDIGKELVCMMIEGAGFNVVDIGVDKDEDSFLAAVKSNNANLVGLSALLTTTMPCMELTVAALKKANLGVKVMVGGAPVTQEFADKIGADGYAEDAGEAVVLARKLIEV